jgi:hypothetical protein
VDLARFLKIARSRSTFGTRRGLIRSLAVGALGVAIAKDASAGKRSRRKKKQKQQRRRNDAGSETPAPGPGGPTPGPGAASCTVCDDADDCSFTSIQTAINAATAGSTITICQGKYKENFTISKSLTLIGDGDNVQLEGAGDGSVVTVPSGVTATLQNLVIEDGTGTLLEDRRVGGGIFNQGDLTLNASFIQDNNAELGAGIFNLGGNARLTLINGTFVRGNDAQSDADDAAGGGIYNLFGEVGIGGGSVLINNKADNGGAIYNGEEGVVSITGQSRIEENTANAEGGGIYNDEQGQLTIDGSMVIDNKAKGNGGGIFNNQAGTLTIRNNSEIGHNEAQNGGGVYNQAIGVPATMTLFDSAITENEADDLGGGIFNTGSSITIQTSTIFENDAGDLGGGIFNTGGGAITIDAQSAVIENKPDNCIGTNACGGSD